jgi:hypothetical protein
VVQSSRAWKEEAFQAVGQALEILPHNTTALDVKGFLLHSFGEDKALEVYKDAIGKDPNNKYL